MLHRTLLLTLLLSALPAFAAPEASQRAAAAEIPILGKVLAPGGEPKAKVAVWLEPIPPTYERARLRLEGKPGPEPVARTRTAADGTFEIAAPEAGMWKVVVEAKGVLRMEHRLMPLVGEAVLPPLELVPAADLEVRLQGADGKARPGWAGAYTLGLRTDAWRPLLRLARAGEDGVAHLPLGKGERIQLEVLADGHPLQVFELYDESSVTIDVPAGVAGTVRITDGQKRPLAGAVAFQGSALLPLALSGEKGRMSLTLAAEDPPEVKVVTADRWHGSFELDFASRVAGDKVQDLMLEPPVTLSGQVLDLSSRKPVPGALVWAVRGELAVTDAHGGYQLDMGAYTSRWVQAQATGYLRGFSQLRDGETRNVPPIALDPESALSGKVVDSGGGLLAGVEIQLTIAPGLGQVPPAAQRRMRDGWRGRTSARGTFRVAGLPAGVGYRLALETSGFAPLVLDVEPLEPFESRSGIEAVMLPGRVAVGRVVDADDSAVAGAEIRLQEPPPTDDLRAAMRMMRARRDSGGAPVHVTDAEGRFEIADLAPGRYDLEAKASGFAPARVPGVRVDEAAGGTDFGTVVLLPGASIEGRVTDPDSGALAGVEVSFDIGQRGALGMNPYATPDTIKTGADGRFVVADLVPGQPVTLGFHKEGFGSESAADLRPPTDEPLAIVLRPAGRIEGRVIDRQGDPIQGASVMTNPDYRATRSRAMMRHRPAHARSGADGRFVLENVEPGPMQVMAEAEGYQRQVHQGVEVSAGKILELELVLEAGAVIEGTVTTADGEPVVQASINVSRQTDNMYGSMIGGGSGGQTDVEGRYRVTGVPEGTVSIGVYHDNRSRLTRTVEVKPGTNVFDLVLERGFEIAGQVVGPDATPIAGAGVTLEEYRRPGMIHFSTGTPQTVTTAGGIFSLTGVTAGKYTVQAKKEGYAPAISEPIEVSADVTGLLLELRLGATLRGRVVGLEFDDLGSLALVAYSQHGGMRRGRVDFSAEYAFDNLAPGPWHVQAQVAGSGRSATLQVEIPEGAPEVEKDIEFGTGFSLAGVVLDGGEPLAGASVSASSSIGSAGHAQTGGDGRFRIEGLEAGSYQVMVMAGMGMQHMESVELAGDHELLIELSTGAVTGLVKGAGSGKPLPGAVVVLERLDAGDDSLISRRFSFGNRGETDSRGFFQVPHVRQGSWRLVATKPGYAPGETTVAVAGGATAEVEIRLTPTEGVSFEVVLESGAAIPRIQIAILDPSGGRLAAGSHPVMDGKAKVSTVPPGRWDLLIQGGDSAATRFTVNSPGNAGRVVLPIGGTLHVKVPELEQVPVASIRLTGPGGQPFMAPTGISMPAGVWILSGGQAMVPGLVPGVWSFTVEHDGRSWSGSAAVTARETTEVSLP